MKRKNRFRRLTASLLAVVFLVAPLTTENHPMVLGVKAADFAEEYSYLDEDGFGHINSEITWSKGDHIIEKGLYVEDGGVLNIEKGARILFRKNPSNSPILNVYNGRIVAKGTQDEKITFASTEKGGMFEIIFDSDVNDQLSFFRHVEFIGSQISYGEGGSASLFHYLFGKPALADQVYAYPIISYYTGKVHVENSIFKEVKIEANGYVGEQYNQDGFVEIVNSNFEFSEKDIAIKLDFECYADISEDDCKRRLLLKNNWYGDELGPDSGITMIQVV